MSALQNIAAQWFLNIHGANGGKAITPSDPVTPDTGYYFCAIYATEDTEVADQEDLEGALNPELSELKAGTTVYGKWTSITLTSGALIGYYAKL